MSSAKKGNAVTTNAQDIVDVQQEEQGIQSAAFDYTAGN